MRLDKSKFTHQIHAMSLYFVKYFFVEVFGIFITFILLHYQLDSSTIQNVHHDIIS